MSALLENSLTPNPFTALPVLVTFSVCFLVLAAFVFFKYAIRRHFMSKNLPGNKHGFFNIFGDFDEIRKAIQNSPLNNYNTAFLQLINSRASLYRKSHISVFWLAYTPYVQIYTAQGIEDLISGTRTMKKGSSYKFLHPWLGTGLLTSFGPKWKSRRKLLTPSFHFDILKEFLPVINDQAQKFVKILEQETTKDYTDVVNPVTLCSLDIICETTLGVKINAQENKTSEYVMAVLRSANIISERMLNVAYWNDFIFQFFEDGKQFKKDLKLLHDFTRAVIFERKQKLLSGVHSVVEKRKKKALLDVLLEHHVRTEELSEEDIREEVDTFAFEGHDTTSMGISWTLYLIGLHKDVQEKLHEEVDRVFGDDKERPITWEDLKDMNYLENVIKETLRLFPSVPFITREATEDIEICGYKIPKGTECLGITYQIHRDESVFPDPEKFDPDRFLPENTAKRHPYAYIPFSAGPRNCIGQRFAQMELKTVIACALRNFTLESLDTRDKLVLLPELILRSHNPIRVRIRPRNQL